MLLEASLRPGGSDVTSKNNKETWNDENVLERRKINYNWSQCTINCSMLVVHHFARQLLSRYAFHCSDISMNKCKAPQGPKGFTPGAQQTSREREGGEGRETTTDDTTGKHLPPNIALTGCAVELLHVGSRQSLTDLLSTPTGCAPREVTEVYARGGGGGGGAHMAIAKADQTNTK